MSEKWRKVGKIKDAHGLKGELHVFVFAKEAPWASKLKQFGLAPVDQESSLKLFQVERAKPFKDGLILKPQDVVDRTQAEGLKGLLFFVPDELFISQRGETIYLTEIKGFSILDTNNAKIGTIVNFSSNLAQDLLVVEKNSGDQVEIPFVSDFIVEIDFNLKSVKMSLPEGLLDIDSL